jgi:psiF repeat-containing protein
MKTLPTLMVAAFLTAGSAFAAATDAPTATPAAATPAAKPNSAAHCEKLAHEKKLKGDEEKTFVKDCRAGKKA